MLAKSECLVCFLDDINGAMKLLKSKESLKREVMAESLEFVIKAVKESEELNIPSWYITRVHRILKRKLGENLLFKDLRSTCNRIGKEIAQAVRKECEGLSFEEKLKKYMMYAMAGNHLDFRTVGTGYGIGAPEIRKLIEDTVEQGLTVDDRDDMITLLHEAGAIVYIPDNVGEIAFDRLLIDELVSVGKKVIIPYRGGAITSDAVKEDLEDVGLGRSVTMICAGPDTLGISMDEMSDELKDALGNADLAVTKGQANFYLVHEYASELPVKNIVSILTTKCSYASGVFGYDQDRINVVKVIKRDGRVLLDNSE